MDKDVQRVLDGMDRSTPTARAAADEVASAVRSSPYLCGVMRDAAHAGALEGLLVSYVEHEGGHYDGKRIALSAEMMQFEPKQARQDTLTFVLGHEVGHALLKAYEDRATKALETSIDSLLMSGNDRVDVDPAGQHLHRAQSS